MNNEANTTSLTIHDSINQLDTKSITSLAAATDDLVNNFDSILSISSKIDPSKGQLINFNTMSKEKFDIIEQRMGEINRVTSFLSRRNSQTSNRLMTLTMLNDTSPFRVLKQCAAQIETKRNAIKETVFELMEKRLDVMELTEKLTEYEDQCETENILNVTETIEIQRIKLNILKKMSEIYDSASYLESSLKQIGEFQEAYNQVCKNKNIPVDWDEREFEEHEVAFHIRQAFINGFQDIMVTGSSNHGTLEYMRQMGINPQTAYFMIRSYIKNNETSIQAEINNKTDEYNLPSYKGFQEWLDKMVDIFKDEYKVALKEIGLDSSVSIDFTHTKDSTHDGQSTTTYSDLSDFARTAKEATSETVESVFTNRGE